MSIVGIYQVMFSWLPVWLQVVVLGFLALIVIFMIVKIVAFVLDAIPFL